MDSKLKYCIVEAAKFGYELTHLAGREYICKTRCNRCGDNFAVVTKVTVVDEEMQCRLPLYCFDCQKEGELQINIKGKEEKGNEEMDA